MPLFKRRPGIAVVEMHGVIGAAIREPDYSRILERVANNRKIGALVLDIDSPGGSATASDLLYESRPPRRATQARCRLHPRPGRVRRILHRLRSRHDHGLPCGPRGLHRRDLHAPILQQLLNKVGVEISIFKGGHLKDMSGFWRHPTDEETGKFQDLIAEIYSLFVSVVADSRNMTTEETTELATGELYTAPSARDRRLIDRLGNLDDAVAEAMRQSGARHKIRRFRPKRPFMERLTPFRGTSTQWRALSGLASMAAGGMYMLEPGFLGYALTHTGDD